MVSCLFELFFPLYSDEVHELALVPSAHTLTSFVHFHSICSVGSLLDWFFLCSKNIVCSYMCLKKSVSQLTLFHFVLSAPF